MQATKILPDTYCHQHTLNLGGRKQALVLNGAGIILLFIFGWLFMGIAAALNPRFFVLSLTLFARSINVGSFILIMVAVILLHELSHAFFFWLFTRERPKIGLNLLYAYAAAPDWYFPRRQFILIGLAPLLVITSAGLLLLPFVNFLTVPKLVLALTVNAAGAVGDILVTIWLLAQPSDSLVRDEGPAIHLYHAPD